MPFDSSAIDVDIVARKRVTEKDSLATDPDAQRHFTLRPVKIARNWLMLKGESTSNSPGIYLYEVTVSPRNSAYKMPDWISEWDMPPENLDRWKNNPNSFNGATTLNLHPFVSQLWQTVTQTNRPVIAHLFCYLQK